MLGGRPRRPREGEMDATHVVHEATSTLVSGSVRILEVQRTSVNIITSQTACKGLLNAKWRGRTTRLCLSLGLAFRHVSCTKHTPVVILSY